MDEQTTKSQDVTAIQDSVAAVSRAMMHLDLSANERKVLAIKLLPETIGWTVRAMAAAINMPERTWRGIVGRERFKVAARAAVKQFFASELPDIARAYVHMAKCGDRLACERLLVEHGAIEKENASGTTVNVNLGELKQIIEQNEKANMEKLGVAITDGT